MAEPDNYALSGSCSKHRQQPRLINGATSSAEGACPPWARLATLHGAAWAGNHGSSLLVVSGSFTASSCRRDGNARAAAQTDVRPLLCLSVAKFLFLR